MTNFGFAGGRSAEGPGFNGKLPEVLGLLAAAKLEQIDALAAHRAALDRAYRERLGQFADSKGFEFQAICRRARQARAVPVGAAAAKLCRAPRGRSSRRWPSSRHRLRALFQPASRRAALVPGAIR
jgi:hypothetical protein